MPVKTAQAQWTGDFKTGQGMIQPYDGDFTAHYSFGSIFADAPGTNPMEMLGASIAACYTGALAAYLGRANYAPEQIHTDAQVHVSPISEGYNITRICLHARVQITGIDTASFEEIAEQAKCNCPVAQALSAVEVTLQAELIEVT